MGEGVRSLIKFEFISKEIFKKKLVLTSYFPKMSVRRFFRQDIDNTNILQKYKTLIIKF